MANWTTDANQALHLSLVRSKEDTETLSDGESYVDFHPGFTYPIYGEEEKIYGYNDLVINLKFASGTLQQYLSVSHAGKLDSSETVDDPEGTLSEFIASGYFTDEQKFLQHVEEQATEFRPMGQLLHSYTRPCPTSKGKGKGPGTSHAVLDPEDDNAVAYEVYHTKWDSPGFREYHRRMQLFILLYIEGGSYIQEDEDSWEFFLLFEKRKRKGTPHISTYHFIGYSSLYPFYCFPDKVRMRLSQFVILPPYQRNGHGSELYSSIYRYVLSQPNISELTIEDPAEAFEDLRDKNDLTMLLCHPTFMEEAFSGAGVDVSHNGGRVGGVGRKGRSGRSGANNGGGKAKGKIGPPTDRKWAEKWRVDLKLAGRQYHRLIEMLILRRLDPADQLDMKAYRLQVKERLYRFNFEILAQLEKPERLEKLEETFQSVLEGYSRILTLV